MDKSELKKAIKPLIKECVREVLMEQGLLKIVSESTVVKPKEPVAKATRTEQAPTKKPVNENHRLMMEEIGRSGYLNSRFDPFSGTQALTEAQATGAATGPMSSVDPNDPGVDISNLMNGNKNVWKALVGGKGK